jgi:hypothetical protein
MTLINIIPEGYAITGDILTVTNNDPSKDGNAYPFGTYRVSASSNYADKYPYHAFNEKTDLFWASDKPAANNKYRNFAFTNNEPASYVGGGLESNTWKTKVNNRDLYGEWIQIQAPHKLYLDNYTLLSHPIVCNNTYSGNAFTGNSYTGNAFTGNSYTGNAYISNASVCGNVSLPPDIPNFLKQKCPKQFFLLGSNDGSEWDIIDQRNLETYPMDLDKVATYYVNTRDGYTHFRLIINELFKGDNVRLYKFGLFGYLNAISGTVHPVETFANYENTIKYNNRNIYMHQYKPFSSFEPLYNSFNIIESFDVDVMNTAGNNINSQLHSLSNINDGINNNYNYLRKNIPKYNRKYKTLNNHVKYDFSGNVLLYTDKKPTLADGLDDDLKTMIIQENNLYILGTIAMATLLIGIVVISRD